MATVRAEYRAHSPTPDSPPALLRAMGRMYATEPELDTMALKTIRAPIVVADGEYEQFYTRAHPEALARLIPGARLVIIPDVSHGGSAQGPARFHEAVARLLEAPARR